MLTQLPINYRKDIAALRGIAVLLVILHHLHLGIAPAGFIGVDVFFVISGFLITEKIITSLKNGTFSLKEFYLHRMRRILPALVSVLFVTTLAAWVLLLPNDLKNYTDSLFATLLSVSNIYFWRTISLEYFATNAQVIPLLHTWSLGIEEQFYLFWPALLALFFYLANIICQRKTYAILVSKTHTWRLLIATLLSFICIAAMLSFLLYCFTKNHPAFNYYSPITRAFELLCGALLACVQQYSLKDRVSPWSTKLRNLASIAAIGAILLTAHLCTEKDFPSLNILLPLMGAATLIYTGRYGPFPIGNQWISSNYLIFIGLISYSLYLWHWPIIAFLNYFMIPLTIPIDLCVIAISIYLAYLTWKYIECPFRKNYTYSITQTSLRFFIMPCFCALLFALPVMYCPNFGYNKITRPFLEGDSAYYGLLKKEYGCIDNKEGAQVLPPEKLCTIGDLSAPPQDKALLIGDSHAAGLVGMIDVMLKKSQLKAYVVTQSGSPFLLGNITNWRGNLPMTRNKELASLIRNGDFHFIIMGGFWNYYKNLKSTARHATSPYGTLEYGLKNAVAFIIKNNKIPVIFLDNAPLLQVKLSCGFTKITQGRCYNDVKDVQNEQRTTRSIIMHLKKQFAQLIVIDPNKILCDKKHCYPSLNNIALYSSDGTNSHLAYAGSQLIGNLYQKQWGNPFTEPLKNES